MSKSFDSLSGKVTLLVKRVRRRGRVGKRVRIGASDASLTAHSGVAAVAEFVDKLDVVGILDRGVGSIKKRARGVTAGELLVGMAQSQLLGADALVAFWTGNAKTSPRRSCRWCHPSRRRRRPGWRGGSVGSSWPGSRRRSPRWATGLFRLLPVERRVKLSAAVTVDMDATDVEVYGSCKQQVAYNYAGQRTGRPHLATWAEAGVSTAAELLAGNDDVRRRAAALLRRALAGIPEQARVTAAAYDRLRVRADAGYFTADLAHTAVAERCDFAVAAKRNTAMWRAYAAIGEHEWVDATDMPGAQVAAVDYAPAGWSEHAYTIVRRVRVDDEDISADPRSRRRRSIDPDQLALALQGHRNARVRGVVHRHQYPHP